MHFPGVRVDIHRSSNLVCSCSCILWYNYNWEQDSTTLVGRGQRSPRSTRVFGSDLCSPPKSSRYFKSPSQTQEERNMSGLVIKGFNRKHNIEGFSAKHVCCFTRCGVKRFESSMSLGAGVIILESERETALTEACSSSGVTVPRKVARRFWSSEICKRE